MNNGLPEDDSYLECGLPDFLNESIQAFVEGCNKSKNGENYSKLDCDFCFTPERHKCC